VKPGFRLTRSTDFERVRRLGKSFPHPLVVLVAAPNQLDHVRVGVAAGRSVGNAVQRNRAKRLLRAGMDCWLTEVKAGWDFVLLARKPLAESGLVKTRSALETLLKRANLLVQTNEQDRSGLSE
jgi:ribonuclease P protein component